MSAMSDRLVNFIYNHIGSKWCGSPTPPGDHHRIDFGPDTYPQIAVWNNDGYELWIGMNDRWHTHMPRSQARRLAWFIFTSDLRIWFGLRRKVWYWALHQRVRHYKSRALSEDGGA